MKQGKKHSSKHAKVKESQQPPRRQSHEKANHKGVDKRHLAFEIEVSIYEVDKIFEGQGDKLKDSYVIDSLTSFVKVIKDNTFEVYAEKLKEGSDDESDMMHINIVNRIASAAEEMELEVSDAELVELVKQVLTQVKKASSPKASRAYLDPLAKRLKEMGFKSEFLTDTDVDGETIRLEDIENIDDLGLDEDDDLDLDSFRPKY
jgi:hypothetical protein